MIITKNNAWFRCGLKRGDKVKFTSLYAKVHPGQFVDTILTIKAVVEEKRYGAPPEYGPYATIIMTYTKYGDQYVTASSSDWLEPVRNTNTSEEAEK